jgi:hypothetical protein
MATFRPKIDKSWPLWPFGLPVPNDTAAAGAGGLWRVAVVGGGRLGQYYAEAFCAFADTELVAVV